MLAVNLDFDRFDIPEIFAAKPAQIKQAHRRAMGKTIRWLSTRVSRELGQQFDLPQRVFQVRAKRSFDHEYASLWIGLNPIAANWLGKARQTRKGVSVRSHKFNGAFIAKMKNGHIGVFQRGERRIRNGKVHYPLEKVAIKVNSGGSDEIESSLADYQGRATTYFQNTFEHELKYILNRAAA